MKILVEEHGFGKKVLDIEDFNILEGEPILFGRSRTGEIFLDDQKISREQGRIFYQNSRLYVENLSPKTELWLNGTIIDKAPLEVGDKLSVGDFLLVLDSWDYNSGGAELDSELNPDRELEDKNLDEESSQSTEILTNDKTEMLELDDLEDGIENIASDDGADFLMDDPLPQEEESTPDETEGAQENSDFADSEFPVDGEEESPFAEDDFAQDDFSDGFDSPQSGVIDQDSTQIFRNFMNYSLRLSGPFAPFDRFTIEDGEVLLGRNVEKCQISLQDPEVSATHSKLTKAKALLFVEDLNSSNGTLVNGERVNKKELTQGDVIQVGSTTFIVETSSELIAQEEETLMPVDDDQFVEVEEIVEQPSSFQINNASAPEESKSVLLRVWKDPEKRRKAITGVAVIVLLWVVLDNDTTTVGPDKSVATEQSKSEGQTDGKKTAKLKKDDIPLDQKFSPEDLERLEENYVLAMSKFNAGEYYEAKEYLDVVYAMEPDYKNTETLMQMVKDGYREILRLKEEEKAEKEKRLRDAKIKKLIVKIDEALKEKNVAVGDALLAQVLEMDPENSEAVQFKIELDAYKAELKMIAEEKAKKEAIRKKMLKAFNPGKNMYLKQRWYEAINRLEKFLEKEDLDEDLTKEASDLISKARQKLDELVNPLLGQAKSYEEGQDLKRAYEAYIEVLKHDPINIEALNKSSAIMEKLENNSKKIYREALISESLHLHTEAKEKYEQVQQVSPINSEYYIKATDKLKKFLE